jgi:hypothetical protein
MSRRAILSAAIALLVAPAALAAPVPAGPKDDAVSVSAARLLKYRKVQKELKMTAEQRVALIDALEDIEEDYEKKIDRLAKMPNAPDDAFDKLDREHRKAVEKLVSDTAEKQLTPAQRTRLRQIDWQLRGPAAFADPRVQKLLNLTDDQKEAATALAEQAKAKAELYLSSIGDENEEKVKAEVLASRKEAVKKFTDSFTADQRDTWKAALGDPVKGFDVEELWLKVIDDEDMDGHK